jgi:epoxyqueuosine reductase
VLYGKLFQVNPDSPTAWIVERAKSLGFDLCGVVRAAKFPELTRTQEWLDRGYAGGMRYLHDPRRTDPQSTMTEICSVIVCAVNYNTAHAKSTERNAATQDHSGPRGWISRYAWGSDYHDVLRKKLEALARCSRERFGDGFDARVYADTGPVQERILAKYAGLGWLGKNTLLLNQHMGSWMFLGAVLTNLDLQPTLGEGQLPPPDLCGNCRRCIDACPTDAFVEPYVMDARRCISYLTIELRGSIPEEFREPIGSHVFGCDICQDVCPWNRRAPETDATEFQPRTVDRESDGVGETGENNAMCDGSLFEPHLEWLADMDEAEFRTVFRGSSVKRIKWRGLVRNACIALGNSCLEPGSAARERILLLLGRLSKSEHAEIAESALWAMSRIQLAAEKDSLLRTLTS